MADLTNGACNQQQLHHLISKSKWCARSLMDEVARRFATLTTKHELDDDLQLIIDESGFAKKGKSSHGVSRQYNGSAGKIDNCQVGVFGALNAGSVTSIIDARLFEPSSATSKIDHAEAIIYHVIDTLKLPVKYVSFDAFYGRDTTLLAALRRDRIHFIADVPDNLQVCLHPFQMRVPKQTGSRGRKPIHKKPTHPFISARDYAKALSPSQYKTINVRHSSKGKLKPKYHQQDVYLIDPNTNTRMQLTLLIRKDEDGSIKYSLCHAPVGTSIKELAYQQSKRYFIERSFQDGKQQLGMNEYQCRSKESWEKHMSLCMLAMLFINQEKLDSLQQSMLYLTAVDIKQLIVAQLILNQQQQQRIFKNIIAKAPPDKASANRKIYIRI